MVRSLIFLGLRTSAGMLVSSGLTTAMPIDVSTSGDVVEFRFNV